MMNATGRHQVNLKSDIGLSNSPGAHLSDDQRFVDTARRQIFDNLTVLSAVLSGQKRSRLVTISSRHDVLLQHGARPDVSLASGDVRHLTIGMK